MIPSAAGAHDEVWLAVARTVNGQSLRSVEVMAAPFEDGADTAEAFFVDSGLAYDGPPAATLGGLDHLEGETVQVLADGAVHPARTVSGGAIALERPAARVHAGLGYESKLETMRFEAGAADGTAQGKRVRIHEVAVRLWNTLGAKVGAGAATDTIPFRSSADPMGAAPAPFTGDRRLKFPKGYTTAPRVTVVQDQPLPLTVLAVLPRLAAFDG